MAEQKKCSVFRIPTIKNCQSTNLNGSAICNKSNSQLILNGVTFENCKTLNSEGTIISDRGVVFIGSALTLEGDNKFVNCNGADIFLERNTIIKAENANHLETINIIIEDPSTRTAKDVVLNYIDENRIQLMNSGYKLISNDKDLQFSLSTDMFNR